MKNMRGLECFVKAVEAGSIAAGARLLGLSAGSASQNIARLERELGAVLLTRSTRAMALTPAGTAYYARVRDVHEQLAQARDELGQSQGRPQGKVRIACTTTLGRHLIAPLLAGFMAQHPHIELELLLSDEVLDPIKLGLDLSVCFRDQLKPGMVARKLLELPMVFCAAPSYLARAGTPTDPMDLSQHDCLGYRFSVEGRRLRWGFERDGVHFEPEPRIVALCNDIDALAAMAVAGAGITRLGSFVARPLVEAGLLKPLFLSTRRGKTPQLRAQSLAFFICYRDRRQMVGRHRLLVDYLLAALQDHPALSLSDLRDRPPEGHPG
ncbi:DNA-binding transcriptional LysR family regulator [Paucibacter oligotrophus]|uniref:DNA-binding transcriptional LysR family regulator n=1 Tax=Roseateles oligotrophus TaxID=1769250 RepID=A0A840L625_9BURK|nr:LysR family transcriptional regulator [Roseateles oligotrophus]MBB4842132.1 DNA-binding transcriptional LysR family regulator [Roseateles oligotrophus]